MDGFSVDEELGGDEGGFMGVVVGFWDMRGEDIERGVKGVYDGILGK